MLIQLKPEYGKNYSSGQFYFTYTINNPVSAGITWFSYPHTNEYKDIFKVSHVGLCIGEGMGISAKGSAKKVDFENLDDIFNDPKTRIFFKEPRDLTPLMADNLHSYALRYLGIPYNFRLATGFAVVNSWMARKCLSDLQRKRLLKRFNDTPKLLCSQFASLLLFLGRLTNDSDFLKLPAEVVNMDVWKKWKDIPNDKK